MAGLAALAAAYVLSQFYRSFLAVLTPALITELGATKADLSIASGAYFAAFALAQFGVGVSLDRFGPTGTASILLGLCGGGGAFLFAAATAPWMVTLAMMLIGVGCAPVLMASVYIFARQYSPAKLAILTSWLVAFGSAGNVIGASPLASAADALGWRSVMALLGVLTVLSALSIWLILRDPERIAGEGKNSGLAGYAELMRMPLLWAIIPLTALNYAPAIGIRGLWAGPYLTDVYSADVLVIGQVTLFMALAMVAGGFAYGPLDQIFRTRKWVAVPGNIIVVLVLAWLAFFPTTTVLAVTIVLIVIGFAGATYGLMMAHARAFIPAHLAGRGMTLMNFFSIGGVGAMQFATGGIVTASVDPANPAAAYQALFAFYAVALGISVAIYLLSRDAPPHVEKATG